MIDHDRHYTLIRQIVPNPIWIEAQPHILSKIQTSLLRQKKMLLRFWYRSTPNFPPETTQKLNLFFYNLRERWKSCLLKRILSNKRFLLFYWFFKWIFSGHRKKFNSKIIIKTRFTKLCSVKKNSGFNKVQLIFTYFQVSYLNKSHSLKINALF